MKTPEEYLKAAYKTKFPDIDWENSNFIKFHYKAVFEEALKAMQSDHDKEVSSIREGVEQVMRSVVAADPTLLDVCLTIIRDDIEKVLTQFRKG